MKTEIHKIKDFIILTEQTGISKSDTTIVSSLDEEAIGFVFYASGNVLVDITYGKTKKNKEKGKGDVSSFYYSPDQTKVKHHISKKTPLQKISLFITPQKLIEFIENEETPYSKYFRKLINPTEQFVFGTNDLLTPEMQNAIYKILNCQYKGVTKNMLLESQVIELLSHHFNQLAKIESRKDIIQKNEIDKLHYAKEILLQQIETPPSLTELSKQSGLNTFKLKTGFKKLFGLPVYQYLRDIRLCKAYEILETKNLNVQEVAWFVGYESLSAFSNAFYKKFGFRPSKRR